MGDEGFFFFRDRKNSGGGGEEGVLFADCPSKNIVCDEKEKKKHLPIFCFLHMNVHTVQE